MLSTLQIINVHTWLAPSVLEQHRQHNKSGWCTFHYKQKIVLRISVYPRDKLRNFFGRNPRMTPSSLLIFIQVKTSFCRGLKLGRGVGWCVQQILQMFP